MTKTQMTLDQFVTDHKVTATVEWANSNPNMDPSPHMNRHFSVVLRRTKRQMRVFFSQGDAHTKEPTAQDVLDCLASDASTLENTGSFEDWARDLGYDPDSRRAERTYQVIERQAKKLRQFLGDDAFDQLLWHTERM